MPLYSASAVQWYVSVILWTVIQLSVSTGQWTVPIYSVIQLSVSISQWTVLLYSTVLQYDSEYRRWSAVDFSPSYLMMIRRSIYNILICSEQEMIREIKDHSNPKFYPEYHTILHTACHSLRSTFVKFKMLILPVYLL